jgi:hypothetical protein
MSERSISLDAPRALFSDQENLPPDESSIPSKIFDEIPAPSFLVEAASTSHRQTASL